MRHPDSRLSHSLRRSRRLIAGALAGGTLALTAMSAPQRAEACGCFTPPDPSVPVVQAGERIVFAKEDGKIVANIQIQYSGNAAEFGWLLPLPSVPDFALGTDELFNQVTTNTQPKYKLNTVYQGNCGTRTLGFGGANSATPGVAGGGGEDAATTDKSSPLVVQDSVGPYDYAVLKADNMDAVFGQTGWLAQNRYFVPAGTTDAVGPYIHTGAYFLALKLRSGKSAGDLQPVVVKYASDLPMIPIVLTSVGANPNMGIQVWMLGEGRAIPHNYFHTVINDAAINWFTSGANYNDVIIAATLESAPLAAQMGLPKGRHTFVTEFAGSSDVMKDVLDGPARFGTQAELAKVTDTGLFLQYLLDHQFGFVSQTGYTGVGPYFGPVTTYTSAMLAILEKYIPMPDQLKTVAKVSEAQFYSNFQSLKAQYPGAFTDVPASIDAAAAADELFLRVVQPALDAGVLFRHHPKLTRLYTTLSPEDMNRDPVFSFNPSLPDVNNVHQATLTYSCDSLFGNTASAELKTEQGFSMAFPNGNISGATPPTSVPSSLQIQILSETGAAETLVDNSKSIHALLGDGATGCSVAAGSAPRGGLGLAFLVGNALLVLGLRRRRRA